MRRTAIGQWSDNARMMRPRMSACHSQQRTGQDLLIEIDRPGEMSGMRTRRLIVRASGQQTMETVQVKLHGTPRSLGQGRPCITLGISGGAERRPLNALLARL